ncbi:aromatic ring-hydroxylating dioxygenase subunit alpha [Roseovarius pelagicus]|uniref:Aromatic ring-hydroxylating dioxygenase subunit alpha n=1 Tax=Roseovarius pelagicus TaxID=2980108 RepID=A0ABY6D9P6_9RHOB|nr:aromatic ring-hydroxylating dioxygenase subunit alpha [Roseovarius pelagicus]UXX82862.1 aromatic ring-hydroxylating dioxygenase subunit alpha [Roseovarius pelagicus]
MSDVKAVTGLQSGAGNFRGYHQSAPAEADEEIARIGPGTAGGEYIRRFWHPIYITEDLGELPEAIKILGEELVLFRYGDGKLGLVHKYCPHRRASLEYGKCEDRGIRCCYHGWLFAPDGEILETPAEDSKAADMVRERTRLGAYPVIECRGLIFAYMGPPEKQPEFPIYDAYLYDGMTSATYKAPYTCNWIQVLDAILDPTHTTYLHSQNSHPQFSDGMKEDGVLKFYERNENQFLGSSTRRIGDNAWVRVNELILPNFTQAGSAYAADGTEQRYFGRSCFTRWVVPVDDENSIVYAWANFGDRWDPHEYNTREGHEMIEQGEVLDRTPEEKKRYPADSEAVEGMGPISTHKGENLMPTDRGISLYRRRVRKHIRDLVEGIEPPQPVRTGGETVRTYGQDTVLTRPPRGDDADDAYLEKIGDAVMQIQFSTEALGDDVRDQEIIRLLKEFEAEGEV